MNIFSVFSTQGSQGLGAVKGVEAAQSAKAAARQEGVGEVHDGRLSPAGGWCLIPDVTAQAAAGPATVRPFAFCPRGPRTESLAG